MDAANNGGSGTQTEGLVAHADEFLMEDIFESVFDQAEVGVELVGGSQGGFELHLEACHDGVYALCVEGFERTAARANELAAGVFGIMLIDGVVDDALEVALIVAYAQAKGVHRVLHMVVNK